MQLRDGVLWGVFFLGVAFTVYSFLVPDSPYPEAKRIGLHAQTFSELMQRFEDVAREKGAPYAFAVLLHASLPQNVDVHLLGHVVGDIMYEQRGIDGIADCTQDFRNACSHAVVIGALSEFGTEALPRIRDACKKAPGGGGAYTMCFHGLGHGVFAYFGYSFPETIAFCRSTGTSEYAYQEFSQCVGGAVMELMGGGGHDKEAWFLARKKYLDASNPLAPCNTSLIPDEAKAFCLIYLTPRLFELAGADLGSPDPSLFSKAFSFCEEIPESSPRLRGACYGGFGKEFVVLAGERDVRNVSAYGDRVFEKVISWCSFAGTASGEEACISDAIASVFWGGENDPDAAFRFCALAPSHLADACYTRLAEDIAQYVREKESIETLCVRVPDAYQSSCRQEV